MLLCIFMVPGAISSAGGFWLRNVLLILKLDSLVRLGCPCVRILAGMKDIP